MVSIDRAIAFGLTAFLLVIIPGPSVLFTVSRALSLGTDGALTTLIGNILGTYLQIVAVAVGVGALLAASEPAFLAVKLVGAAYLVYLGVRAIRHRHSILNLPSGVQATRACAPRLLFDGLIVGIANPKTVVFFTALLPQFTDPSSGNPVLQMLLLGVIDIIIMAMCEGAWVLAASTARAWFGRRPERLARAGVVSGLVMIGLGLSAAAIDRR